MRTHIRVAHYQHTDTGKIEQYFQFEAPYQRTVKVETHGDLDSLASKLGVDLEDLGSASMISTSTFVSKDGDKGIRYSSRILITEDKQVFQLHVEGKPYKTPRKPKAA